MALNVFSDRKRETTNGSAVGFASYSVVDDEQWMPIGQFWAKYDGRAFVSRRPLRGGPSAVSGGSKDGSHNPDGYYNLASTYHKLGVTQKDQTLINQSEALYHQCLDLAPTMSIVIADWRCLLVESGRPDRAFALLKKMVNGQSAIADAKVELSRLHQEFGETKTAERYLDEALAMDPTHYRAWRLEDRCVKPPGIWIRL